MKSLSRTRAAVCLGLVIVAGCGEIAPDPVDPGPDAAGGDTVAPQIIAQSPADGASEVAPEATVSIVFDEPIAAVTLTAESFRLVDDGGAAVPGTVTAVAAGGTFTPSQPLQVDRTYTATVTSAVTDVAGNPLAADRVWSFAPHRRVWGSAGLVETTDAGPASDHRIAVDGAGNAVAVWKQSDGTRNSIWAARFVGGSWQAPVLLETDDRGEAQSPQVALDAAGNATVVWNQSDGTRFDIYATYLEAGVGWRTPHVISPQLEGNAYAPQLAVAAAGTGFAVWEQLDLNFRTNVWASRFMDGGWTTPVRLETNDASDALAPTVALDPSGDAVAVWLQSDGAYVRLAGSHFRAAAGWTAPTTIDTAAPGNSRSPSLVVAGGIATVVWVHTDGARDNIYTNRAAGAAWGSASLLETSDAGDAYGARVAADAAGNAIAVWYQSNGTRFDIWASHYVSGTGWTSPSLLETDDTADAAAASIARAPSGEAVATWMQSDGTRYNVVARRYLFGAWQPVTLIETEDAGHAIAPEVAVDAAGNAVAVWTQSDGTRTNIAANALR